MFTITKTDLDRTQHEIAKNGLTFRELAYANFDNELNLFASLENLEIRYYHYPDWEELNEDEQLQGQEIRFFVKDSMYIGIIDEITSDNMTVRLFMENGIAWDCNSGQPIPVKKFPLGRVLGPVILIDPYQTDAPAIA